MNFLNLKAEELIDVCGGILDTYNDVKTIYCTYIRNYLIIKINS